MYFVSLFVVKCRSASLNLVGFQPTATSLLWQILVAYVGSHLIFVKPVIFFSPAVTTSLQPLNEV